ncbi:hypothetical protein [Streptacidiphilus sp. PAMC 29251]
MPDDPSASKAARVGDYLLAAQTDRQRNLSARIYDRLKAGAEVDDVRDLIEELSRTGAEDLRRYRAAEKQHQGIGIGYDGNGDGVAR